MTKLDYERARRASMKYAGTDGMAHYVQQNLRKTRNNFQESPYVIKPSLLDIEKFSYKNIENKEVLRSNLIAAHRKFNKAPNFSHTDFNLSSLTPKEKAEIELRGCRDRIFQHPEGPRIDREVRAYVYAQSTAELKVGKLNFSEKSKSLLLDLMGTLAGLLALYEMSGQHGQGERLVTSILESCLQGLVPKNEMADFLEIIKNSESYSRPRW